MRLLHTADWQLGLRLNFVPGEAGARVRHERFATVRRIAELARQRNVDVVVVAGDVFDDNAVGRDTLQLARDALTAFGDIPVVLLPGNHDPATPDSALLRLAEITDSVFIASECEPLCFGALALFPCPLRRRHEYDDPSAWLPARADSTAIRVALAHGGVLDFGQPEAKPNRIDVPSILARGFDYVALGDWHGLYQVDARAWYSGAPEPTRFKEREPGYVLLVDIPAAGIPPEVTRERVAGMHWTSRSASFAEDADVDALARWLGELAAPSHTLLEFELSGQLSLGARTRLEALLADYGERLALLRVAADTVTAAPTDADLEALAADGYLGRTVEVLREGENPSDTDALRLLYQLMQEPA